MCSSDLVGVAFNQRQHFVLYEFRIGAIDRVVLESPLAPLRVLAARANQDRDDWRHATLVDQIVEDGEELLSDGVAAVANDDERRLASRDVARRNIDIDSSGPGSRMGAWNKKVRLVAVSRLPGLDRRIEAAVRIIPDHAGIEDCAVVRRHGEGIDLARGRSVLSKFRRGGMCRPDDEIAFRLDWRKRSVGQLSRLGIIGILGVARWRQSFEIEPGRVDVERRRWIGRVRARRNAGISFQAIRMRRARDREAREGCDSERVHDWRSPLIVVLS